MKNYNKKKQNIQRKTPSLLSFKNQLEKEKKELVASVKTYRHETINDFLESTPSHDLDQADLSAYLELQEKCKDLMQHLDNIERTIIVDPAKLPETIENVEKVLVKTCLQYQIYQRSGKLVRVIKERAPSIKKTHSYDSPIIKEIDQVYLTLFLSQIANFMQFNKNTQEYKPIACGEHIARYFLSKQEWELPVLTGIISAPTLRADGTILNEPGYDKQSGLLLLSSENFEKIPTDPSEEDAKEALSTLLNVLKDFPFENDISCAVAIAAILTALTRKAMSTAPLFGFSAPKMASGKSLLADVVSLIATGKPNSVISQAENETEEKKRLLGILMEGDPIVCYDNIERPFGGSSLCSILTQREYKDRKLGVNESRTVLTQVTFLATGNNLSFIGDTSTRVLLCNLDPQVERPEERTFDVNLHLFIPLHRASLIRAGITIVRAYIVAGKPQQDIQPFGRFEEWSDFIRSPLIWLGMDDPCESRKEIEDADPVRISLGKLFHYWHELFGSRAIKVKEAITVVNTLQINDENEYDPQIVEEFKDVVLEVAENKKGGADARKLAARLRKYKNRIEQGYRLEQRGQSQKTFLWSVRKIESPGVD